MIFRAVVIFFAVLLIIGTVFGLVATTAALATPNAAPAVQFVQVIQ